MNFFLKKVTRMIKVLFSTSSNRLDSSVLTSLSQSEVLSMLISETNKNLWNQFFFKSEANLTKLPYNMSGVVNNWRHAILDIFRHLSPHRNAFYFCGLYTVVPKSWTPPPNSVTSFIDDPLWKTSKSAIYKRIA